MEILYLTARHLITINAAQEGGVGVADMTGVEQNAVRPQSGFGDYEAFPDLWSKAAAYVHGIATTQYFTDGNKRTAWLAAVAFLDLNGMELHYVPDIEAETFVLGVAQSVFKTDGYPDVTIEKTAEWFRSKWEQSNDAGRSDRVDWAMLGRNFSSNLLTGGSTLDAEAMGIAVMAVPDLPAPLEVHLAVRCHFLPVDAEVPQTFDVKIEHARVSVATIVEYTFPVETGIPVRGGHAHHPHGLMPVVIHGGIRFTAEREGLVRFVVTRNGKLLTKLPLAIHHLPEIAAIDDDAPLTIPDWLPKS